MYINEHLIPKTYIYWNVKKKSKNILNKWNTRTVKNIENNN